MIGIAVILPRAAARMAGYGIYRGLLGHVDTCSPVDLLDEIGAGDLAPS